MDNNAKAYEYLISRGATRLCHFTKVQSLTHILLSEDGIIATEFIPDDIRQQNDMERLDNAKDFVSCSLQYPNCWYWEKAKKRDDDIIFKEWVVLTIDLGILKDKPYKYCRCNAAKGSGTYIQKDLSRISDLFGEPTVQMKCRTPNMLMCCPSDDQAEIIVYKNIPIRYVNGIIVGNDDSADNISAILKTIGRTIPVYVSAEVCNRSWSNMVRQGVKPIETEYNY
jgi:hypothetical protein